jgi:hypothetical protein
MDYSKNGVIYTMKTLARERGVPPATEISGAPLRDERPAAEPRALTRLRRLPASYLWGLSLAVVLLGALRVEFANIANTLPYPHHVDEPAVARAGLRVITTGSFRPESFNYPALPKYLTAAGLGVGVIRAARNAEFLTVELIGNVGYPYYDARLPMQTARQLFVLLSALALAMTAVCAWHAFRRPAIILLAPLITLVTPLYFFHSWSYLNVDIVGTCFVMMTLAACFAATWRPSVVNSAIVPGFCAGLATGSKYTLAVAIVPVLLGVWLFVRPGRRIVGTLTAIGALVAAFLLVAPYSVLDLPAFVNDVAYEGFHYATRHPGFDDPAGLAQLRYYAAHLIADFRPAGMCLAALGLFVGIAVDARRTAMLLALPVASLGLLIQERVHFTRNVLAFHPIIAVFVALGLLAAHESLRRWMTASRWSGLARQHFVQWAAAAGLIVIAVPPAHVLDLVRDRTDSRVAATAWLASRVSSGWTVVVPEQLSFSIRELQASGLNVKVVDLQHARTREAVDDLTADVSAPSLILVPRWGSDPNFVGAKEADKLNDLATRWRPIKTFGTQVVQVNHPNPAPDGDPAFFVAALSLPDGGITWLEDFDNLRKAKRQRVSGSRGK